MNSYKEMYYMLLNKITDVINDLQAIQAQAEELFVSQEPEEKSSQIAGEGNCTD